MKVFVLLFAIVFGLAAHASDTSELAKARVLEQATCKNFVRADSDVVLMGMSETVVRAVPVNNSVASVEFQADAQIVDAVRIGSDVWALTGSTLEQWSLKSGEHLGSYSTHNLGRELRQKEFATGMAVAGNKILIAHGRLGLSVFDMQAKTATVLGFLPANRGTQASMATGVAIAGANAYVLYDEYTVSGGDKMPAFRGLVIVDLQSMTVKSALNGLDPGSSAIVAAGDSLYISMYGSPIYKFAFAKLNGKKMPRPTWSTWKFPLTGHPLGIPSIDEKFVYTCFMQRDQQGVNKSVPAVFDRKLLDSNR